MTVHPYDTTGYGEEFLRREIFLNKPQIGIRRRLNGIQICPDTLHRGQQHAIGPRRCFLTDEITRLQEHDTQRQDKDWDSKQQNTNAKLGWQAAANFTYHSAPPFPFHCLKHPADGSAGQ